MKTVAILGPTASGKTALSLRLAKRYRCAVLSLDSLAIYREIDIASAKPTPSEREGIPHYGIDLLDPDRPFNVATFVELYKEAKAACESEGRHLIVVGGTGFYLKTLLEGISPLPPIDASVIQKVKEIVRHPEAAHRLLRSIDPEFAGRLAPGDRYRLEKALQLHYQTGEKPTDYYRAHPPRPVAEGMEIFEISLPRDLLWERIRIRTKAMIEAGLVDEVARLEKRYGRAPHPMKAIGIAEVLDYFDGKLDHFQMVERIAIHTRQLAKRQSTFNRTQFAHHPSGSPETIERLVSKHLEA